MALRKTSDVAIAEANAISRFQREIADIAGVRRVWVPDSQYTLQFWVLLDAATLETVEQVLDLERDLVLAVESIPVEVFVYGADEVDPSLLPDGRTIYERTVGSAASR